MRHRSRTNSRRWEDLWLRAAYREENPWCEFSREKQAGFRGVVDAADVHHIGHQSHRWDAWSNLISLSREAHEWCHKHPTDGVLVSTRIKIGKGEFDAGNFERCVGRRIEGYVEKVPSTPWGVAAAEWIQGWMGA